MTDTRDDNEQRGDVEQPTGEDNGNEESGWFPTVNVDAEMVNSALRTRAYSWLVAAMQRSLTLDYSQANILHNIQEKASTAIRPTAGAQSMEVVLFWNPRFFVQQQGYGSNLSLTSALTISGTAMRAQLLPGIQYLRQTWPSIGEWVLDALIGIASSPDPTMVKSKSSTSYQLKKVAYASISRDSV